MLLQSFKKNRGRVAIVVMCIPTCCSDEVITNPYLYVPKVWFASQVVELTGNTCTFFTKSLRYEHLILRSLTKHEIEILRVA